MWKSLAILFLIFILIGCSEDEHIAQINSMNTTIQLLQQQITNLNQTCELRLETCNSIIITPIDTQTVNTLEECRDALGNYQIKYSQSQTDVKRTSEDIRKYDQLYEQKVQELSETQAELEACKK